MSEQPQLSDFLISNREGTCLTQEGVDAIWPVDDREPLFMIGKTPWKLPATCKPGALTLEEQVGRDKLITFIFDGGHVPTPIGGYPKSPEIPSVPLPGSGVALVTALVFIVIAREALRRLA